MDGEGCFYINIIKDDSMLSGINISIRIELVQHKRDIKVLAKIIEFLGCGNLYIRKDKDTASVIISKLSDVLEIMIPFFDRYPLQGVKKANYFDFRRVAFMMRDKAHLTEEGSQIIVQIKSGMNTKRVYEIADDLDIQSVKRSSDKYKKCLYLYDASTLELMKTFSMQRDLLNEFHVSCNTVTKYQDTGLIFRGKYIITTKLMSDDASED